VSQHNVNHKFLSFTFSEFRKKANFCNFHDIEQNILEKRFFNLFKNSSLCTLVAHREVMRILTHVWAWTQITQNSKEKTTRKTKYESEREDRNLIRCQSGIYKELYCVGKMSRTVTSRIAEPRFHS